MYNIPQGVTCYIHPLKSGSSISNPINLLIWFDELGDSGHIQFGC